MSFDGKNLSKVKNWLIPFSALFVVLAYLSYVTLLPLLQSVAWAVVLAFISYPMYCFLHERIFGGQYRNICAAIMTVLIIFLIIAPTIIAGSVMAREAMDMYYRYQPYLMASSFQVSDLLPAEVAVKLNDIIEEYPRVNEIFLETAKIISSYGFQMARNFLGNTLGLLYSLLIIFLSYFFLIRDGHLIIDYVKDIVPLLEDEQRKFVNLGKNTLRGVIYGITLTAIVQGILGAIGWWMVDLPSPFLFGALMAFMAMIPFVGTPSVWLPGTIYLLLIGQYKNGLILLAWGIFVVSMVDNFLRPKFISDRANISTFLVFLGAFGGIFAWGFIGLFIGPLILSLSVFFLDSYRQIWKMSLQYENHSKQPS